MIPKIIHYVWVGTKPKPDFVLKCIESWKKYCPDYEIMEWGNESLKEINNLYVSQALEYKKWAFVSDYLRLYALSRYGGFYFDTDLEITQNIDKFLELDFVSGYENYNGHIYPIVSAFMGAKKETPLIKALLNLYENIPFVQNGELDQTTNTVRIARYFQEKYGLSKPYDGTKTTVLEENCILYPSYYFCVPEENKENYSVHHFNGSWFDAYSRKLVLSFMNIKILRFKKTNKVEGKMNFLKNERKLLNIRVSPRKTYSVVWIKNKV